MTSYLNTLGTQGQALCHHGLSSISCWMGSMNCKWKHYWCHLHFWIKLSVLPSQHILVYIACCDWQRYKSVNNRSCRVVWFFLVFFLVSCWEQLYKSFESACDSFTMPYLLYIPEKLFYFQWNWPPKKLGRGYLLWILTSEIWRDFHIMRIIGIPGTCHKSIIHKKTWLVLD